MSAAGWEAFARYATWVHGNPAWEAGERTPRLAIAAGLRDSVAAASAGSGWREALASCLYSPGYWRVDLTLRGQDLWFWPWLKSGDPRLREAVAGFGRPDIAPRERFAAFADAAASAHREGLIKDAPGSVIAFGSLLNFAMEPERLPFVLKGPYSVLERLLSGGNAQDGSVTDKFERHLNFGAEVADFPPGPFPRRHAGRARTDPERVAKRCILVSPARKWGRMLLRRAESHRTTSRSVRSTATRAPTCGVDRVPPPGRRRSASSSTTTAASDDHREVLAPYVESGEVVVHESRTTTGPRGLSCATSTASTSTPRSALIAFIDLAEFLFSPDGRPLPEVLRLL